MDGITNSSSIMVDMRHGRHELHWKKTFSRYIKHIIHWKKAWENFKKNTENCPQFSQNENIFVKIGELYSHFEKIGENSLYSSHDPLTIFVSVWTMYKVMEFDCEIFLIAGLYEFSTGVNMEARFGTALMSMYEKCKIEDITMWGCKKVKKVGFY